MTDTQSSRNNVDDTLTRSNNDIFNYRHLHVQRSQTHTTTSIIGRFSFKDISSFTKILSMTDTQSSRNNVDDTLTRSNNDIFNYRHLHVQRSQTHTNKKQNKTKNVDCRQSLTKTVSIADQLSLTRQTSN